MTVIEIASDSAFSSEMSKRASTGCLVVVDFNAEWCGPCRMMKPVLEQLSNKYTDVAFLSVNSDHCQQTARTSGISGIPAFHFYINGSKVGELIGANPQGLQNLVEQYKKQAKPASQTSTAFSGQGHRLGDEPMNPIQINDQQQGGAAEITRREPDAALLVELCGMGFSQELAEKALLASNNDLGVAIDWITANQDAAQIQIPTQQLQQPEKPMETTPTEQPQAQEQQTAKKPVLHNAACNVCLKQIEGIRHKCKVCSDYDLCSDCLKKGTHGHDSTHDFLDITEETGGQNSEVKPLSEEEIKAQQQRVREMIANKRKKREEEEQRNAIEQEVNRRKSSHEIQKVKELAKDAERKRIDEERMKDARESREALERVKKQIEQDRLERKAAKQQHSGQTTSTTTIAAPQAPISTTVPDETPVQVRLPDGSVLRKTFNSNAKVKEIHSWVVRERKDANARMPFALLMTMPRKLFATTSDMNLSLIDAGIAPSATLVITAPPRV